MFDGVLNMPMCFIIYIKRTNALELGNAKVCNHP